jgi:hypothetical protein
MRGCPWLSGLGSGLNLPLKAVGSNFFRDFEFFQVVQLPYGISVVLNSCLPLPIILYKRAPEVSLQHYSVKLSCDHYSVNVTDIPLPLLPAPREKISYMKQKLLK